jgi:hypothetical protein
MPKPCPEKPLAMKKPGNAGTAEITGTASGVTSISPAQRSTSTGPSHSAAIRSIFIELDDEPDGFVSGQHLSLAHIRIHERT